MPDLYTLKEIASKSRRSYETIRRWITDGQLEAININGQYLISSDAFEKFLKAHSTFGTPKAGGEGL